MILSSAASSLHYLPLKTLFRHFSTRRYH